jgi:hypothetical protein
MIIAVTIIDPAGAIAPHKAVVNLRYVKAAMPMKDVKGHPFTRLLLIEGQMMNIDEPVEFLLGPSQPATFTA